MVQTRYHNHIAKYCLLLLPFLLPFSLAGNNVVELSEQVTKFCEDNGKKYLSLFFTEKYNQEAEVFLRTTHQLGKSSTFLRTRRLPSQLDGGIKNMIKYDQDALIISASNDTKQRKNYMNVISKTKIKTAIS